MSVAGFGDTIVLLDLSSRDYRYRSIWYTIGIRLSIFTYLLQQSITRNQKTKSRGEQYKTLRVVLLRQRIAIVIVIEVEFY